MAIVTIFKTDMYELKAQLRPRCYRSSTMNGCIDFRIFFGDSAGIEDGMMYFYRIRAADYSGNWSDYSEVVQLSTLSNDNDDEDIRFPTALVISFFV